jgi:hypothetical protein
VIRASLTADDTAVCAQAGLTVTSASPIITLCRLLIESGFDPAERLLVYRDGALVFGVSNLRHGAGLKLAFSHGFARRQTAEGGAPVVPLRPALAEVKP